MAQLALITEGLRSIEGVLGEGSQRAIDWRGLRATTAPYHVEKYLEIAPVLPSLKEKQDGTIGNGEGCSLDEQGGPVAVQRQPLLNEEASRVWPHQSLGRF